MKISILMANYNNGRYIKVAIESVIRQTFLDWELIIIDDASTDNSVEIIKSSLADKRIRFLQNEKNLGYINTLKCLVSESKSSIFGILDSDDTLDANAIAEVMKIYKENPDIDLVYTQNYRCDQFLKPFGMGYSSQIPINNTNLRLNLVHHFRVFKKSAYAKTTGYDEKILYAEDVDLVFKIEEIGKLYFLDKPLYYYRILKGSQTHTLHNELINKSSTALAKLNAYERRLNFDIPNLNKVEIAEVLFWGIITSFLAGRFDLTKQFIKELKIINPFFFLSFYFYKIAFKKIAKIIKLKSKLLKHDNKNKL